ncbi:MAG: hypothetical protein VX475_16480, partial [Myxococcota bacterium]|nr:hypothetical protein [Myxococcota bacterium]
ENFEIFSARLFDEDVIEGGDKIGGAERFLEEGVVGVVGEFGEVVPGEPGDEQGGDLAVTAFEDFSEAFTGHGGHEHIGDDGTKGVVGIFEER